MSRIKYWLSRLGIWLWLHLEEEKTHIAFRHTCGSEAVQLANFRGFGAEFQCFKCNTLVPIEDIKFRVVSTDELEILMSKFAKAHHKKHPEQCFSGEVLLHTVIT